MTTPRDTDPGEEQRIEILPPDEWNAGKGALCQLRVWLNPTQTNGVHLTPASVQQFVNEAATLYGIRAEAPASAGMHSEYRIRYEADGKRCIEPITASSVEAYRREDWCSVDERTVTGWKELD